MVWNLWLRQISKAVWQCSWLQKHCQKAVQDSTGWMSHCVCIIDISGVPQFFNCLNLKHEDLQKSVVASSTTMQTNFATLKLTARSRQQTQAPEHCSLLSIVVCGWAFGRWNRMLKRRSSSARTKARNLDPNQSEIRIFKSSRMWTSLWNWHWHGHCCQ